MKVEGKSTLCAGQNKGKWRVAQIQIEKIRGCVQGRKLLRSGSRSLRWFGVREPPQPGTVYYGFILTLKINAIIKRGLF